MPVAIPPALIAPTSEATDLSARLLSKTPAVRSAAVEEVLRHPDAVDPFDYAPVVQWLWESGRRRHAAFWFYLFQERTRPWALADRRGDAAAALRSSLNDGLGRLINGWIASDVAAWQKIASRAIAYEKRFPLYRARPPGLDQAAWTALVARSRDEYDRQAGEAFAGMKADEMAAARRANGLPVGPLDAPGPALPEAWR